MKNAQFMLWHLAWKHFKTEIMRKNNLNDSSRACPDCHEPKCHLQQLIIHFAQKHHHLRGIVDENVMAGLEEAITQKEKRGKKVFLIFSKTFYFLIYCKILTVLRHVQGMSQFRFG